MIEQNAEIGEIDEWGKRWLAYLINDEADGFYVLYNFVSGLNSRLSSTVSARSLTACFAR
ncbi:MAG: 30S ribosomal protein S6 [[Clostridium] leptum]